jgi:CRP-like cAMP-binding protein
MKVRKKPDSTKSVKTKPAPHSLLHHFKEGKDLLKLPSEAKLFSQGELGDAIYFIQTGRVRLTVVSVRSKEAVLAVLGPFDFLGEECLVGNSRRTTTATSMGNSTVFRIEKKTMLKALHGSPRFSEEFIGSLLTRTLNLEEDLCDQLFNHSERRLACALLKLTHRWEKASLVDSELLSITREMLAKMVGTSRSKISVFLTKFRKLGLVDYKGSGSITVKAKLLTEAVLHD